MCRKTAILFFLVAENFQFFVSVFVLFFFWYPRGDRYRVVEKKKEGVGVLVPGRRES